MLPFGRPCELLAGRGLSEARPVKKVKVAVYKAP